MLVPMVRVVLVPVVVNHRAVDVPVFVSFAQV
jgi:hypothetical protein